MTIRDQIIQNLSEFDANQKDPITSEDNILSLIRRVIPNDTELDEHSMAELIAFSLKENNEYGISQWKTYYGPSIHYQDNGETSELIKLDDITPPMIEYWRERIEVCQNPVLKSRYAGLVWVFQAKITGKRPDPNSVARIYIRSLIDCIYQNRYFYSLTSYTKLKRAGELASTLKLEDLKNDAVNAMIDFEQRTTEIEKPGTWLKAFEFLVDNKNLPITKDLEEKLRESVEEKFMACLRLNNSGKYELHSADEAFKLLAAFYQKHKRPEDVDRILITILSVYNELIENAEEFQSITLLEKLHKHVSKYGSKDQKAEILRRLREKEPLLMNHMKPVEIKVEISKDHLIAYSDSMLSGSVEQALDRIGKLTIPDCDTIFENQRNIPGLTNFISKTLHDGNGRKLSSIGAIDSDKNGNKSLIVGRQLQLCYVFDRDLVRKGKERQIVTEGHVMSLIEKSGLFHSNRFPIIRKAVSAFLKRDFVTAMHLWIPQIEAACLNLLDYSKGTVRKISRNEGMSVRTFDSVLTDPEFIAKVSENTAFYLRTVLTSDQAWNLRNIVCHGLSDEKTFSEAHANRIFFIVLYLAAFELPD